MKILLLLLNLLIVSVFGTVGMPDPMIRRKLLEGYDVLSQPYPYKTTVTIPYLSVTRYDIDDQQQTFELHGWIVMKWKDDRLRWENYSIQNPNGYIHFTKTEIWTPEITTFNTANPTLMNDFSDDAHVLVQSNGAVIWVPRVRFITNCKMNFFQWPFDQQHCHIKIISWTYNEQEMDLQFDSSGSSESRIKVMSYEGHKTPNNTQWVIVEWSAVRTLQKDPCCAEKAAAITFYFKVGRKSSIFTFTLVLPVLMLTVVSLIGFLLPLTGNSRVTLAGFNLLVITSYMIYFRIRLPTIDHVPSIVRFFTWNLFVTTMNLVLTVTLVNLTVGKGTTKIPDWGKILLNSKLVSYITFSEKLKPVKRGSTTKMRSIRKGPYGEHSLEEVGSDIRNKPKKCDWTALVNLFDKACFALFALISFIMAIALLI